MSGNLNKSCKQSTPTTLWILFVLNLAILPASVYCDAGVVTANDIEDLKAKHGWVGSDAWSQHRARKAANLATNQISPESCDCPPTKCVECHNNDDMPVEVMYYKQFVAKLFDPHRFREIETDTLSRTLNIHITKEQLSRLNELLDEEKYDMHDLNELVTTVMFEANDRFANVIKDEMLSIYESIHHQITNLVDHKTMRFILYCIAFLLTIYVASRWSRSGFLITFIIAALLVGYGFEYIECNYQKEIDQIIAFKRVEMLGNPCDQIKPQQSWFAKLFEKSSEEACMEHIRKMGKIERDFCQPMEVAVNYVTKIHFLFVEKIIKSAVSTFKSATESSSFIEKIIIGVIVVCLMIAFGKVFISSMISSVFKHGLSNILHRPSHNESQSVPSGVQDIDFARDIMNTWRQSMEQQTKLLDSLSNNGVNVQEASKLLEKLKTVDVTKDATTEEKTVDVVTDSNEASSFEFVETVEEGQGDFVKLEQKKDQ